MRAEYLAAEVGALEIGVEHLGEVVVGNVEIGHRRIHAGAVDEDVGPAAGMDHSLEKCRHARAVDRVDRDEHAVAASGLDRIDTGLAPVGAAARHDDKRASPGQTLGEGTAEHARASDDHGRAAREPEQVFEIGVSHGSLSCEGTGNDQPTGRRRSSHSVWNVPGLSVRSYVWAPK